MRIMYSYKDIVHGEELFDDEFIVGRNEMGGKVDVDLNFDRAVSHKHVRILVKDGRCWIEDLHSRNGTTVNGESISDKGSWPLREGDVVQVSDTKLWLEMTAAVSENIDHSNITVMLDARKPIFSLAESAHSEAERRLAILYELPLQFGGEAQLDSLLMMIAGRLVDLVSGSTRAAVALKDPVTNRLLLKAHVPPGDPFVSMTLARRALDQKMAFVWQRGVDQAVTLVDVTADSAMYAPLLWKGSALGVIMLDNYEKTHVFQNDDLKLLMAVAQQAAMAVANQMLQEELRRESVTKSNFLRQFSPKIAERILSQRGRLKLGGERCEATILFADIRGFSQLSRKMEPEAVVELLNYYFTGLIPVIYSQDGSVDKYVGDAILAVFGSPEPDVIHFEKSVHAAVGMQKKMAELNSTREAAGEVVCNIGIGVHCGEVVHGFVGMPDRMGFTVIGEAVNRAARYCSGAKAGEVLISPDLYERVWRIIRHSESVTIDAKLDEQFLAYKIKDLWQ